MPHERYYAPVPVLAIAYSTCLALAIYQPAYLGIIDRFYYHFSAALFLSLICSVLMVIFQASRFAVGLVFVHAGLIYLIGYPLGESVILETLLGAIIVTEIVSFVSDRSRILLVVLFLAGLFVLQQPMVAWGRYYESPELVDRIAMTAIVCIAAVAAHVSRTYYDASRTDRKEADWLRRSVERVMDANVRFQQYARDVETETKQNERKRISREVHDMVGYAMTNLMVMLDAAQGLIGNDDQKAREIINSAREQASRSHAETRNALHVLRSLREADSLGIKNVRHIAAVFQEATGVNVRVEFRNTPLTLGPKVDMVVNRFVQEALANSFRHGHASNVEIMFWVMNGEICVSVHDDGVGAQSTQEGIGFLGMRERLSQVGGELGYANTANGFLVRAWIPLRNDAFLRTMSRPPGEASARGYYEHD